MLSSTHCYAQLDLLGLPCCIALSLSATYSDKCNVNLFLINVVQWSYCWPTTTTSRLQPANTIHLEIKFLLCKQVLFLLQAVDINVFSSYFYKCFSPLSLGMQLIVDTGIYPWRLVCLLSVKLLRTLSQIISPPDFVCFNAYLCGFNNDSLLKMLRKAFILLPIYW